jgi:D-3-phosphoglycerate dehydrogenase
MDKVTGIGGIFFKTADPKALAGWYQKHLGIDFGDQLYVDFKWESAGEHTASGNTVFSLFSSDTKYFDPGNKPFMINFRVKDLEKLLAELKDAGVKIAGEMESYDYGKFGWIMDPEGNKIELWEPPVDDKL